MESLKNKLEETAGHILDYIDNKTELTRLQALDLFAKGIRVLLVNVILAVLVLCFIFFMSLSLAIYLSEILESKAIGFLIVGLVYAIILSVFYLFRKSLLEKPLLNLIVKSILSNGQSKSK